MGKITETFAKRVKPPETGHFIHYDGEIDGFGLRVTAKGQRSFVLNYRIFGKERRYTIGKYPDDYRVELAREKAIELRQGIRNGQDPFLDRQRLAQEAAEAEARSRTVRDLATAYMERRVKPYRRAKTAKEYQALIDAHILPQLGRFRVSAVTQRDVTQLHVSLKGTPYLANRVLAVISAMFNWAKKDTAAGWGVGVNPVEGVERYHEEPRVRWLTEEEMQRLTQALDQYPHRRVAGLVCSEKQKRYLRDEARRIVNAIRLLLLTGARRSEVLGARWGEFDLDRGRWTKPSHRTKQQRTETIPISDEAVTLLKSMPRNGEFLFPGRLPGQPITDIKQSWHEICEAAGIAGLRLHDLRHNFASWLVSGGESLAKVGALLGHTQAATTQRYAHLADQPLRDAVNRFGKIVGEKGKPPGATKKGKEAGEKQKIPLPP
jgi:integrase